MNIFLPWAKKGTNGQYHPLILHMIDTACTASRLWEILSTNYRKLICENLHLDEKEAGTWISFIAGLHDLGKANPSFQIKDDMPIDSSLFRAEGLNWNALNLVYKPHAFITALCLRDFLKNELKILPSLDDITRNHLSGIAGGHHGVFPTGLSNLRIELVAIELDSSWKKLRCLLFQSMADLLLKKEIHTLTLKKKDNMTVLLVSALISISDWIASSTEYFPYEPPQEDLEKYFISSQKKAEEAFENIGWQGREEQGKIFSFEQLFPNTKGIMRPVQKITDELSRKAQEIRFIVIEVPMGEGKTEAAMMMIERWSVSLKQQGCYFALPTTAASNQIYTRFKSFLQNRFSQIPAGLLLMHSQALLAAEFQSLKLSSSNIGDHPNTDTFAVDEWFTRPKRGFLVPYAVGTVDQTLLSILQTRYGFIRLFGLCQKTLVFDEIHAYDTYMLELFSHLLKWLSSLETTVVLLSATLPRKRLKKLLDAYGGKEVACELSGYPRITWISKDGQVSSIPVTVSETGTSRIKIKWVSNDVSSIAGELKTLLQSGGCAAFICNTVSKAQETYLCLSEKFSKMDIEVELFHARFPFARRHEIENQVICRYGKERKNGRKAVLVATQVIEQSLDLDFDIMITEHAPVDLLLQRAGRLQRHKRVRPPLLDQKNLWIIKPEGHDEAHPQWRNTVYDEYIMLRSWIALRGLEFLRVPEDVEDLIEKVYGDTPLPIIAEDMAQRLDDLEKESARRHEKMEARAAQVIIEQPEGRDILEQWNMELEEERPDIAESLRALTRLSGPSVNVVCLHEKEGQHYLDPDFIQACSLRDLPDREQALRFLESSVSLSYAGCLVDFPEGKIPPPWKKSSLLRYHRALIFQNNQACTVRKCITFDRRLGLIINPVAGKGGPIEPDIQSDF